MTRKREPLRMCCGCREMKPKHELIRIVKLSDKRPGKEVSIEVDKTLRKQGRGAYLCKNPECLKTALKRKSINRGLRCNVPSEIYEILKEELKANE